MKQTEYWAALEAGRRLEGNGFRVYQRGKTLVVQDLLDGWWAELDTYALPATAERGATRGITGKITAVAQHPQLRAALGEANVAALSGATLTTDTLAAMLLAPVEEHDHELPAESTSLIPAVEELRARAFRVWEKVDDAVVRRIALVTTILAHFRGEANEETMLIALDQANYGVNEAREMLDLACRQGNVRRRDQRAPVPTYYLLPPR